MAVPAIDPPPPLRTAVLQGSHPLLVILAVVAALYIGRDIFIPLALAILLSFVLNPLVQILRRWHFGRIPSVLIAVFLAFFTILAIAAIMTRQVADLASELPRYEATLKEKLKDLRGLPVTGGVLEKASETLDKLGEEFDTPSTSPPPTDLRPSRQTSKSAPRPRPVLVEIQPPPPRGFESFQQIITTLFNPLATVGMILIVVICTLLQREDIRDRVIRLIGTRDLELTTRAMDDAASRLSRLYLAQTIANAAYGAALAAGLWAIGVPYAVLWGIMAGLLRFVPILGSLLAAVLPIALAAAADDGWTMVLATICLYIAADLVMGQLIEPRYRGKATGLSPLAVILATVFWSWAWGPIGLLLATPLTVLLIVLGKHVESLDFLDVVLGATPALTPPESFYQRLLAGHPDEAAQQAERHLLEQSISTYFEEIALPGLLLAQADMTRGALGDARIATIRHSMDNLIDDLSDHEDITPTFGPKPASADADQALAKRQTVDLPVLVPDDLPPDWRDGKPVLVIGGRSLLDEASGAMLAHLVEKHGVGARVVSAADVTATAIAHLDLSGAKLVAISYLDHERVQAHSRFLIRRLRRRVHGLRVVVCLWGPQTATVGLAGIAKSIEADEVVTSFHMALERLLAAVPTVPRPVVLPDDVPVEPKAKVEAEIVTATGKS